MKPESTTAGVVLAKRDTLILDEAGIEIACRQGCLWLTERDGSEDVILEPGQTYLARAPGVLIGSLRDARLDLRAPRPAAAAQGAPATALAAA